MGNRMDGNAIATAFEQRHNVSYLPSYQQTPIEETNGEALTFWQRRALDLQITTMAPPTKPYWNTTMVTAWVAVIVGMVTILGAIGALYLYTDAKADQRGYERGLQQSEQNQLKERLNKAEEELRRTKDLELLRRGEKSGHESNTNTKPEGH